MPGRQAQGPRGRSDLAKLRAEEQWRRTVSEVLERAQEVPGEGPLGTAVGSQFRRQVALRGCPDRDHLRRRLWLLLLGLQPSAPPLLPEPVPQSLLEQLELDVSRSLHHFDARPPVRIAGVPKTIGEGRAALLRLMSTVLGRHQQQGGGGEALHYYQGFHDVASVFLLQVGEGTGGLMMERVSLSHMRFATRDTLDSTREVMALLYPLLLLVSPPLHSLLRTEADIAEPVFCLSWLITWFSHDLHDLDQLCRLFDFFLATAHPLAALYLSVALIEHRGPELLAQPRPADFASCHHLLRSVPQVIPPRTAPSLFTRFRPYLAQFLPVFSRFLRVFTAWPRRFQRAPRRNPGPRNSRQEGQERRTPPFVRHPRC